MTELERQLTAALEKLSAQYAQEQQRQTAQVETLRQQVEQLAGHVTRLDADYRTLAAMLREPWS